MDPQTSPTVSDSKAASTLCHLGFSVTLALSELGPHLCPDRSASLCQVAASGEGCTISGYLSRCKKGKRHWKKLWFVIKGKVLYTYMASEVGWVPPSPLPQQGPRVKLMPEDVLGGGCGTPHLRAMGVLQLLPSHLHVRPQASQGLKKDAMC